MKFRFILTFTIIFIGFILIYEYVEGWPEPSTDLNATVVWWGETEEEMREAANVGCYEVPKLIQNQDGTVGRVMVRVCVWK